MKRHASKRVLTGQVHDAWHCTKWKEEEEEEQEEEV
jgi:hypothetical protein